MIPINSRTLKQQEDSRGKFIKETQLRLQQMPVSDYCSHLMEGFMIKNHLDVHESHNYLGVQPDQYFYDPNLSLKNSWYISNNNCYEDFYNCRIKREEDDEQKLWPSAQIKDQQSISANHENGFQACEFPKQEEFQYIARYSFQDPNKFLNPYMAPSKEEKNMRRKSKVQAYLKKKSMRSFEKKIIYKCRKQVADNRIRYRGRFISLHQAATILKLDPKQSHTPAELMQKLKACSNIEWNKDQKEGKKVQQQQGKKNKIQQQFIQNQKPIEHVEQEKCQKVQQEL